MFLLLVASAPGVLNVVVVSVVDDVVSFDITSTVVASHLFLRQYLLGISAAASRLRRQKIDFAIVNTSTLPSTSARVRRTSEFSSVSRWRSRWRYL
jgi:hypothetical protein